MFVYIYMFVCVCVCERARACVCVCVCTGNVIPLRVHGHCRRVHLGALLPYVQVHALAQQCTLDRHIIHR